MDIRHVISKKRIIFLALFIALVFAANRINFSSVVGADKQYFTLFQFFGPVAGSFLGPLFGAVSVLFAQGIDFLISGKAFSLINIVRLTPMLFAACYFGAKKKNWSIAVPLIAMSAFIIHPVGRQAWVYSLFWTIPVIIALMPAKYLNSLWLKSLGATFTAHAVGTAAWIWSIPMTADQWITLIPITAVERLLFAGGIAVSYIALNTLLDRLAEKFSWKMPDWILHIDKRYAY